MPNVLLGALNATKRLAMDEALSLNQFAVAFKFYLLHFVIYVSSLLLFDANTLRYLRFVFVKIFNYRVLFVDCMVCARLRLYAFSLR